MAPIRQAAKATTSSSTCGSMGWRSMARSGSHSIQGVPCRLSPGGAGNPYYYYMYFDADDDFITPEDRELTIELTYWEDMSGAEVAFVLADDLENGPLDAAQVRGAIAYAAAALEICGSRIEGWDITFGDTVADNASCGVYVLGKTKGDPRKLDITLAGMVLDKNGELFSTGVGAAVQGSPANAVAWLANTLGKFDIPFRKGEIILSGALAPLVPVQPGDEVSLTLSGLGKLGIITPIGGLCFLAGWLCLGLAAWRLG